MLKDRQADRDRANLSFAITANGWYFAQMQFELMRLSRALEHFMHHAGTAEAVELRFELVWSRADILRNSLMGEHPGVAEGISNWEDFANEIESRIYDLGAQTPDTLAGYLSRTDALAQEFHNIWVEKYAAGGYRTILFKSGSAERTYNFVLGVVVMLIVGYLAIEATASIRLASREANARRKADEANAARSLFLANMNHELRTPLNGVLGVAELLRLTELNEQQKSLVGVIQESGKALMTIISDVLEFSKIEAQGLILAPERFDPVELFEEIVRMLSIDAAKKDLDFALTLDGPVPLRVTCDPTRLRQVALNVVGNAVKFTRSGYVDVRLSFDAQNHRLVVTVDDTGPGIPESERERIFDSFIQARTQDRPQGTGLGLAICRKVMEAMQGSISAHENPGGGSRFRFDVPVEVAEADLGDHIPSRLNGARVLLLDPAQRTRRSLAARLARHGVDVVEAASLVSGAHALREAAAAQVPIDLLLLDDRFDGDPGLGALSCQPRLPPMAWIGAAPTAGTIRHEGPTLHRTMHAAEICSALSGYLETVRDRDALAADLRASASITGEPMAASRKDQPGRLVRRSN